MAGLSNEEIAARIVQIYFEEVARLGFRRKLSLDETINSYYYTLLRLGKKREEEEKAKALVLKEEAELKTETKEQILPSQQTVTTTKTVETIATRKN